MVRAEIQRLEKQVKLSRETLARLEAERMGNTYSGSQLQDELIAARLKAAWALEPSARKAVSDASLKCMLTSRLTLSAGNTTWTKEKNLS